jgi:hypothetical protein
MRRQLPFGAIFRIGGSEGAVPDGPHDGTGEEVQCAAFWHPFMM